MNHEQYAYKSVKELNGLLRSKQLSPVELMDTTIARIKDRNKDTNSFIHLDFESARKQAKVSEKVFMKGEDLGILQGIPTAIKDLSEFKPGWPSTFGGIPAMKDNIANQYGLFSERVEQSGSIIVGKTNSPIMGFRGTCDNPLFGPTRNPFDLTKNSGGSSGGSGAAVADGLIPIAQGTDGGGSVRIPSAWCGLYGFQPSNGRVPTVKRPHAFGATSPFLYEGTMTRTVEDAAIGMTAITGYDSRDPFSLDDKIDYFSVLNKPLKGWKIAYSPDLDVFPIDQQIASTVAKAVQVFEEAGAEVELVKIGLQRNQMEYSDLWARMNMGRSVGVFESFKSEGIDLLKDYRHHLPDEFIYWMEHVYKMSFLDLLEDEKMRTEVFDSYQKIFKQYDLLITPTVATLPVDNATDGKTKGPTQINGEKVDPLIGWCLTYFTNFTGHPSASIPAGLSEEKYPIGMQIIGRKNADKDVLQASSVFEKLQPWNHIYEICKNR